MKKSLRSICLALVAALALTALPAHADETEVAPVDKNTTLTKDQIGAISQSCDSIKQTLKSIQKADTKTRSLLGAAYETLLSDFVTPLNLRLVKNDLPSSTLTELHSGLLKKRQDFAQKFTLYAQDFEALLGLDCQKNPEDFYNQLVKTRKSRASLEQAVDALRMDFEKHQNAVTKLKGSL